MGPIHKSVYWSLKFVILAPGRALCVDLVGPYTLKGKDSSSIDFICLAMINLPTVRVTFSKWAKVKRQHVPTTLRSQRSLIRHLHKIGNLVYKCWFSRYPCCPYLIYDNGSEFKLHFCALCATYGVKHKPTSIKNPTANAILERIHAVFTNKLRTAKLNMAELVNASDIDVFLSDVAWAIRSTHHTVLKALTGAAIFGQEMLLEISFIAD